MTKEEFVERAKQIHDNKYDYSKVEYVNSKTKVCIICPIHGEFWQKPEKHILRKRGCPRCRTSKLEERMISELTKADIKFIYQKRFNWLGLQSLDFFLPDYNVAIECQGEQHYTPVDFAGKGKEWARKNFEYTVSNDKLKKRLCEEHNITLLYDNNDEHLNLNKIKELYG